MKQSGWILQERFRSQGEEQRRELFREEFGRWIADLLAGPAARRAED